MSYEIKCFLHYKEGTSDKVYGIVKTKDTIFCFYGKTNPPSNPKDKGTLSIKYYDYMDEDYSWIDHMRTKLNKGYKAVYIASRRVYSYGSVDPVVGKLEDIDDVYHNLDKSLKAKLLKSVLKFSK